MMGKKGRPKGTTKAKIAIAIDRPLLNLIDSLVDGANIQSRSQAIELVLKEGLKSKPIDTAVIVVHEKENYTISQKVGNKTLLEHHLAQLKTCGITNIFLVGRGLHTDNYEIQYVDEHIQTGTADALRLVKIALKNDFVLINGDSLNIFDLKSMIAFHQKSDSLATIGLIHSKSPEKYGSIFLDGSKIIEFREKDPDPISTVIYAGVAVLKSNIFNYFDKNTHSLEKDLFPKLAKKKLLQGYFTYGEYLHLSNLDNMQKPQDAK